MKNLKLFCVAVVATVVVAVAASSGQADTSGPFTIDRAKKTKFPMDHVMLRFLSSRRSALAAACLLFWALLLASVSRAKRRILLTTSWTTPPTRLTRMGEPT